MLQDWSATSALPLNYESFSIASTQSESVMQKQVAPDKFTVLHQVKAKFKDALASKDKGAINWQQVIADALALFNDFFPGVLQKSKTMKAAVPPTPATVQADLDALNALEATLSTDTQTLSTANAALATAQQAQTAAQAAVTTDDGNITTALAQLIADATAVFGTPTSP
jgi:hypothetical protein